MHFPVPQPQKLLPLAVSLFNGLAKATIIFEKPPVVSNETQEGFNICQVSTHGQFLDYRNLICVSGDTPRLLNCLMEEFTFSELEFEPSGPENCKTFVRQPMWLSKPDKYAIALSGYSSGDFHRYPVSIAPRASQRVLKQMLGQMIGPSRFTNLPSSRMLPLPGYLYSVVLASTQ